MYCLDTLNLVGNPICNQYPQLALIDQNEDQIQNALNAYFGGGGMAASASIPSIGGVSRAEQPSSSSALSMQKTNSTGAGVSSAAYGTSTAAYG